MPDLPEDEIRDVAETMVLDAELHNAAAGLARVIPTWFLDLTEAHVAAMEQLSADGYLAQASILAVHLPVLEDGYVGCSCEEVYPCPQLRWAHGGDGVWDELVKRYPAGWDAER
jgi:hypothetical protein